MRSPHAALTRLLLSLLVAGGFIWILQRGALPIVPADAAFSGVTWWAMPVFVILCSLGTFLRTYRWVYLLRPIAPNISWRRVLGSGLVGFGIVFFAPLRTGEIARPWLIARYREVTFLQAAGTVAAERVMDGLALALVLVMGLVFSTPLSPLPDHIGKLPISVKAIPAAAHASLLLFFGAGLVMVVFERFRTQAQRLLRRALGVFSDRIADWILLRIEKLGDGLTFLRSAHSGAFLRDTALYWAFMLCANWSLLRGCGIAAGPAEAAVIMGVVGLGSLIPSGPGFFGAFQFASYAGLAVFFAEHVVLGAGAAFTFLGYSTHVSLTLLSSIIGLRLMDKT